MTKKILVPFCAIACTTFFSCSETSPSEPRKSDEKAEQIEGASANISINSKDFLDTFVDTQKCAVDKQTKAIAESSLPNKPSAEEIASMTKKLEEKSQDTANKEAAWVELTKGCNDREVASIHQFFQCQQGACKEPDLNVANEKHIACPQPHAGEACKKSFGGFLQHFSPL